MAKTSVIDFSTTAINNADVNGVGILGTDAASNMDDAIRAFMKLTAEAITRHVTKAAGSYTAAKTDHNQFWRATGAVTVNLTAAATLTDGWCIWLRPVREVA